MKVSRLKRLPTEWEKIFANYQSDKGLIPESIGNTKNLTHKESTAQ
jgi:hypothetical protein